MTSGNVLYAIAGRLKIHYMGINIILQNQDIMEGNKYRNVNLTTHEKATPLDRSIGCNSTDPGLCGCDEVYLDEIY